LPEFAQKIEEAFLMKVKSNAKAGWGGNSGGWGGY